MKVDEKMGDGYGEGVGGWWGMGRQNRRKGGLMSQAQGNGPLERGFGHGRQTLSALRKNNGLGVVFLRVNAPQLGMPGHPPAVDETEWERLDVDDWPEDYVQNLMPQEQDTPEAAAEMAMLALVDGEEEAESAMGEAAGNAAEAAVAAAPATPLPVDAPMVPSLFI